MLCCFSLWCYLIFLMVWFPSACLFKSFLMVTEPSLAKLQRCLQRFLCVECKSLSLVSIVPGCKCKIAVRRALYICCCPALWSCNRAGVTGKMVFLRLTRNSSICSNSVSLAWAGSYRNIQTTITTCPETQWQRGNGCYRPYLLRGGNIPLPPRSIQLQ